MKRFAEGADREQSTLLPDCLDDWIGDDNARRGRRRDSAFTLPGFETKARHSSRAERLARQLAREALFPTEIRAFPLRFQELLDTEQDFGPASVIICGVDNNPTRRAVSIYGLQYRIPVIHAAVSRDGNSLYVMVQQPRAACWDCAFPTYLNDNS